MIDWAKKENWNTMRTAILTAYPKLFTDIPYAPQLFLHAIQLAVEYGFSFDPSLFVEKMSLEIEARHKALNVALKEQISANTIIMELGAGLSPRRLEFIDTSYLELDYEPIANMKRNIYKLMGFPQLTNDVYGIDLTDLQTVTELLDHINQNNYAKIVVLSEGLFWYLKRVHLHNLLAIFSKTWKQKTWIWLTADCPVTIKGHASYRKIISSSSNKDMHERFVDLDDFCAFFRKYGCSVSCYKITDLLSPQTLYSGKFFFTSMEKIKKRIYNYTNIALITPQQ